MEKSTNLSQESSLESNQASTLERPPGAPPVVAAPAPAVAAPPALTAEEVAFIAAEKAAMEAPASSAPAPSPEVVKAKSSKAKKWEKEK